MKIKRLLFISLLSLTSCSPSYDMSLSEIMYTPYKYVYKDETFEYIGPLGTSLYLKMYNADQINEVYDNTSEILEKYHKLSDNFLDYDNITNIYSLNEMEEVNDVVIDEGLFNLIKRAKELSILTKGKFNLSMGQITSLWKDKFDNLNIYEKATSFSKEETYYIKNIRNKYIPVYGLTAFDEDKTYYVFKGKITNNIVDPSKEEIDEALKTVIPYDKLDEYLILNNEKHSLTIKNYSSDKKTKLDLGGIAKGYTLNEMRKVVSSTYPGFIWGGSSSIVTFAKNPSPTRDYYGINLTEPSGALDSSNKVFSFMMNEFSSISTSGDEEQYYFNTEGIRRTHILNEDGYSSSYHRNVTVYSSSVSADVLDVLSTAIMNTKTPQEIKELVELFENRYSSSIAYSYVDEVNSSYNLYLNQEFKDLIIPSSYSSKINSVTVI